MVGTYFCVPHYLLELRSCGFASFCLCQRHEFFDDVLGQDVFDGLLEVVYFVDEQHVDWVQGFFLHIWDFLRLYVLLELILF